MQKSNILAFLPVSYFRYHCLVALLLISIVACKKAQTNAPAARKAAPADACGSLNQALSSIHNVAGLALDETVHPPKSHPQSLALVDFKPELNNYGQAYSSVVLNFENDLRADVLLWRLCETAAAKNCFPEEEGRWEEALLGYVELPPLAKFAGKTVNFVAKPCLNAENALRGADEPSIEQGYHCSTTATTRPFKMPDNSNKVKQAEIEAALLENYNIQHKEYAKVAVELKKTAQLALASAAPSLNLTSGSLTDEPADVVYKELYGLLKNIAAVDSTSTIAFLQSIAKTYRGTLEAEIAASQSLGEEGLQLAGANCVSQSSRSTGYPSNKPPPGSNVDPNTFEKEEEEEAVATDTLGSGDGVSSRQTATSENKSQTSDSFVHKDPGSGAQHKKENHNATRAVAYMVGIAGLAYAAYAISNVVEDSVNWASGSNKGTDFKSWAKRKIFLKTGLGLEKAEVIQRRLATEEMEKTTSKQLKRDYDDALDAYTKTVVDIRVTDQVNKEIQNAIAEAQSKKKITDEEIKKITSGIMTTKKPQIQAEAAQLANTEFNKFKFNSEPPSTTHENFDFDKQYQADQVLLKNNTARPGKYSALGFLMIGASGIIIGNGIGLAQNSSLQEAIATADISMQKLGAKIIRLQDRQKELRKHIVTALNRN